MERMQNADQVFFVAFIDGRVISTISGNLCANGIPLKISRPHPGGSSTDPDFVLLSDEEV